MKKKWDSPILLYHISGSLYRVNFLEFSGYYSRICQKRDRKQRSLDVSCERTSRRRATQGQGAPFLAIPGSSSPKSCRASVTVTHCVVTCPLPPSWSAPGAVWRKHAPGFLQGMLTSSQGVMGERIKASAGGICSPALPQFLGRTQGQSGS